MGRSFLYKGIGKTFVCKYFACNRTVCSRIVSGLITGSLLMGLYGCGATENTTVSDTQKQESSQEDLEPVTFTFYNADGMEDMDRSCRTENNRKDRCYAKDGLPCGCQ